MPKPAAPTTGAKVWASGMCATVWWRVSMARRASPMAGATAAASASPCRYTCRAMADTLRPLIVDDEPLAIERLQILCARIPRISLVGTAVDGASALRLMDGLKPDLILLDIQMP